MTNIPYMRQEAIFNPINQKFELVILGGGSVGSFVALNLAKLGFNNIEVIDYDVVENYNLPNQFFKVSDINSYKVDALQGIIKDFANVDIKATNTKITPENVVQYLSPFSLNKLYILTFDTLEARKMIYDALRGANNYLIDARMGGDEFSIYTSKMSDDNDLIEHDKMFNITPTDIPCGEKAVIYSVLNIASEVCNIVKKLNNDEHYPKRIGRNMKGYIIMGGKSWELNNKLKQKSLEDRS